MEECLIPDEIVYVLITYTETIDRFLMLRLVNKQWRQQCMKYWSNLITDFVYPRATMINTRECMSCESVGKDMKECQVVIDHHPRRTFVHCNKLTCCNNIIQSLKQVICRVNECRIVQNWKTFLPKKIWIQRSSGKMQEATAFPFYLFLLNHKSWIRVDFIDNNVECHKLVAYEEHQIEEPKIIVF
tara:strand:- start:850 stop:1407 length:558 start_codon:yes stop_codon:yes gene_type:complete